MKTPEEIDKLAEIKYPTTMVAIFTERDLVDKNKERRKIFIEGYNQSQQDTTEIISFFEEIWEQMNGKTDEKGDMVYIPYTLSQKIRNYKSLNKK